MVLSSLVEGVNFRKGREVGDSVDLAKQLADDFACILALTQAFDLTHCTGQGMFSPFDRRVGVVLALRFKAPMMFEELFPEELGKTLTRRAAQWSAKARRVDADQTTIRGHF
jgi:hypothetical protein